VCVSWPAERLSAFQGICSVKLICSSRIHKAFYVVFFFPYCLFSFAYSTEVLCLMCNKLSQIKNADFAKTAFVNPCHLITGYICGTLLLSSQKVSSGLRYLRAAKVRVRLSC
jgi:hypothetical protein